MFTRILVSLAASLLITAGTIGTLAVVGQVPRTTATLIAAPEMIDGLPVTNLPAITVTASIPRAPAHATRGQQSVSLADTAHPLDRLLEGAAAQVANSHLGMPYYSFGSGIGQASRD